MCITEYNEAETMQMFRDEGENRLGELMEQSWEGSAMPRRQLRIKRR